MRNLFGNGIFGRDCCRRANCCNTCGDGNSSLLFFILVFLVLFVDN